MRNFEIGRFKLKFQHRDVGTDSGPTIHIFGPKNSSVEEVLRFDCFFNEPHYHLGFSYRQEPFIRIEFNEPLVWTINKITSDIQALLAEADADLMSEDEIEELHATLAELGDA